MSNSTSLPNISECENGKEEYVFFTQKFGRKSEKFIQYDYRALNGDLFSTICRSLAEARRERDFWKTKTH